MLNSSDNDLRNEDKLELLVNLTIQCYKNINETHSKILEDSPDYEENQEPWCPRTFDGFACWDAAPPATTVYQPCPDYIIGFDPRRLAYKRCTENGTWFFLPGGKRPWTNYTTCVDMEDLSFRNTVNNIYVVGYALSVAALILSIFIFVGFKSLICTRVRIHIHQFTSLALNGMMWIIWYKTVVSFVSIVQENHIWCQVLHLVMNYFMVSTYMWMFCEALHLHMALIVVFLEEEVAMRWFIGVGWGLPLIITAVYGLFRVYTLGDTERCWMDYSESVWIITIPVFLTLIASSVFLVNIVRVLVTKLPAPGDQTPHSIKKAVRATLMLIPLFGLHFILIPLRPLSGSNGEKVYQVVSAVLISFQGLCVAILFCFTNNEVLDAMRSRNNQYLNEHDLIPMTGITAAEI